MRQYGLAFAPGARLGVSNTMRVGLALNAALADTGHIPEIFNTDQGCQLTLAAWTSRLYALDVRMSMDGKGHWIDNVFIEQPVSQPPLSAATGCPL